MEELERIEAAREGVRDGTAVGKSSVRPETTGKSGREKTGAEMEGIRGRLEEGEGAAARGASSC